MSGYVIADVDVHDNDALDEYHKIAATTDLIIVYGV